jgi:hypothetical protein
MGVPSQLQRRWTVAEVRAMQDESRAWPRYELIGSEVLVTPAPALVRGSCVSPVASPSADQREDR